jgi:hypothetical protein
VIQVFDTRKIDARGGERREGADIRASVRAQHLGEEDAAAFHRYQIREGAADLDAYRPRRRQFLRGMARKNSESVVCRRESVTSLFQNGPSSPGRAQ